MSDTARQLSDGPPASAPPGSTRDELLAQLAAALLKLEGIEAISRALGSEHNLDRILDTVMTRTTALLDADRSTLYLVDEAERVLWSRHFQGGEIATIEVPIGRGIAGWVAHHGRRVNVKDAYKDARFDPTTDERSGYRTQSVLCAPLRDSQQRVIGVIQVLNKRGGYFTPADEDLLGAIASQAAISIHNSKLYLDIVGKNIDLLETSMRLESRTAELELLFKVERAAATATALDAASLGVLEGTLEEFPSEAAAVLIVDAAHDALVYQAVAGPRGEHLREEDEALGERLAKHVLTTGEPWRLGRGDEGTLRSLHGTDWEIHHSVALPIVHKSKRLGCLLLINRTDSTRGFSAQDERLLGLIAGRIGLAVALSQALEEEKQAERLAAIGQMLSSVLHDLKTPLTIIGGYARMMVKEPEVDVRQEHRERIRRQISLLKDMTRELLAFARGDSEVLFRKVLIRSFMDEVMELLREDFAGSGVGLELNASYGGAVRMDEGKLKRVIYNLARNAREAMRDGGTFRIGVDAVPGDDQLIVFTFADNGPGIPAEVMGRLFEPFATFGKKNGTGLGLAIVKKIAEEHRGRVNVASEPGQGTTFTLTLPVRA